MTRLGWSLILVFGALFGLFLSSLWNKTNIQSNQIEDVELFPNYSALNLNSKLFDSDGNLSHQVSAAKMEHYEELGFTVFEAPIYTLYMRDREPWQVTAGEATLYDDKRIALENEVKIVNLHTDEFVTEIETSYVEIDLESKIIKSDQLVQILGTNYLITSVGLVGNLNTQEYELSEHVKTQVNPF